MTETKETVVGVLFVLIAGLIFWFAAGWYGLVFMTIMVLATWIILYLFNKKSLLSKTGAVILNNDLLVKLLMPRSSRKAIRDLEEIEKRRAEK